MEYLLADGGEANSQYRNVASGWESVRAYDRESMKRFSLGSHNLTKLNRMISSKCIRFLMVYDIWLWQDLLITEELTFLNFSKTKTPDFKHHQDKGAWLYLPYLYSQQLRHRLSICNPQNFQVHGKAFTQPTALNLRELFSQKLDISGKAEQRKTHPFNFYEKLKHSYRA